jgi:hypothetical protein
VAVALADEQRLAAFVVPRGEAPASGELRRWLRESLPEYMVPASFATLPSLPLLPSGKLDRAGLAARGAEVVALPASGAAPASATEATLARIWSEVLGLGSVGCDRDFFELGGHSLLAMRILSRVREAFGLELQLRDVFETPTVTEMARTIDASAGQRGDDDGLLLDLLDEIERMSPEEVARALAGGERGERGD